MLFKAHRRLDRCGIVTHQVGGRQYIAVAGGSISPIWPIQEATSRVTVYALPGAGVPARR